MPPKQDAFLSQMAARLRGSDVEVDPIDAAYEGMRFKVRRRLPLPVQDWVNAAMQDDGSGRAYHLARRAAASLISISLDDGESFHRVDDLFPAPEGEIQSLGKHFRAQALADRVLVNLFLESEFADEHGSAMVMAINSAREAALLKEELDRRDREAKRKKAEKDQIEAERSGDSGTDDADEPGAPDPDKADVKDTEELFGDQYGPLSEGGLTGP